MIKMDLPENPKLPLLPGFTVYKPKENNHLPQYFLRMNGTNMCVEKKQSHTDWILNDKKILCFKAYFRQNCVGTEKYQIRQVKILYFMEDGTIQVIEPRTDNSGIPQGCIVKRQLVPCNLPDHSDYLTHFDLSVQKQVTIFDRTYTITDCDQFTKMYLNRAGIEVPQPIQTPKDPLHMTRDEMVKSWQPKPAQSSKEISKLERFLKFDNSCLKFDAFWDDRDSPSGDIHNLIVYYYLCDDTIQITEVAKHRRPVVFYKRLKLPKKAEDFLTVHQKSNPPVLNVLGRNSMTARCIRDKCEIGNPNIEYYKDADLGIGKILNVFGRKVVFIDCDKFTRDFYQKKYGVEEFVPIERPKDTRWLFTDTERIIPPYNGFGSYEDSETNCISFELKARQRDLKKFLRPDNCKLRFKARMIGTTEEDNNREFVITYFLEDDTISVYEIGKRNFSSSGDFLKRSKLYLPHADKFTSYPPEQYTSQMLYIGATVHFNGFTFHINDADEFSLHYMEMHESEYPMANISSIMSKIKQAIEPIYKDFIEKYLSDIHITGQNVECEPLKLCNYKTSMALRELLGNRITEHEIVTFLRFFNADKSKNPVKSNQLYNRSTIQSMVQMAITNRLWDDIQGLKECIYDQDPENHNGFMQPAKLLTIIRGCRLPIKNILIDDMFSVLNKDENGNIDVNDFLYFIDSNKCKAPPIQPINPYSDDDKKAFKSSTWPEICNWSAFISALGLEEKLKQETD